MCAWTQADKAVWKTPSKRVQCYQSDQRSPTRHCAQSRSPQLITARAAFVRRALINGHRPTWSRKQIYVAPRVINTLCGRQHSPLLDTNPAPSKMSFVSRNQEQTWLFSRKTSKMFVPRMQNKKLHIAHCSNSAEFEGKCSKTVRFNRVGVSWFHDRTKKIRLSIIPILSWRCTYILAVVGFSWATVFCRILKGAGSQVSLVWVCGNILWEASGSGSGSVSLRSCSADTVLSWVRSTFTLVYLGFAYGWGMRLAYSSFPQNNKIPI